MRMKKSLLLSTLRQVASQSPSSQFKNLFPGFSIWYFYNPAYILYDISTAIFETAGGVSCAKKNINQFIIHTSIFYTSW